MLEKLGSTRGVGHRVGAQGWVGLESGVGFGGGVGVKIGDACDS